MENIIASVILIGLDQIVVFSWKLNAMMKSTTIMMEWLIALIVNAAPTQSVAIT